MSSWSYHSWKLCWGCLRGSTTPEIISVEGNLEKKKWKPFKTSKNIQKTPENTWKINKQEKTLPDFTGFLRCPPPSKTFQGYTGKIQEIIWRVWKYLTTPITFGSLKEKNFSNKFISGVHSYKITSTIIAKTICLTTQTSSNFLMTISQNYFGLIIPSVTVAHPNPPF